MIPKWFLLLVGDQTGVLGAADHGLVEGARHIHGDGAAAVGVVVDGEGKVSDVAAVGAAGHGTDKVGKVEISTDVDN